MSDSNLPSRELKVVRDQRLPRNSFLEEQRPGEGRKMRKMGRKRSCPPSTYLLPEQEACVSAPGCSQNTSGWGPTPELQASKESKTQPIPHETQPGVVHLLLAWLTQIYTIPHIQPRGFVILSSHREAICPPQSYLPSGPALALPSLRRLHPCHSPRAISGLLGYPRTPSPLRSNTSMHLAPRIKPRM